MTVILQDLETERLKEKELRNMLDEQQHQHKLREDEKSKAMEVKRCLQMIVLGDIPVVVAICNLFPTHHLKILHQGSADSWIRMNYAKSKSKLVNNLG